MSKANSKLEEKLERSQKKKRRFFLERTHQETLDKLGKKGKTKTFKYNLCELYGVLEAEPRELCKTSQETLYDCWMRSYRRNNDKEEYYHVVISNKHQDISKLQVGTEWQIIGRFCSEGFKGQCGKFILATKCNELKIGTILPNSSERTSFVYLDGFIEEFPVLYRRPQGEVTHMILQVIRENGELDRVPCKVWFEDARLAMGLRQNDRIKAYGHLQSQSYEKGMRGSDYEVTVEYFSKV